MGTSAPSVVEPSTELWPARDGNGTIALALGRSKLERRLIERFLGRLDPPLKTVYDVSSAIDLASRNDAAIAPIGVAWLPPEREGERHFRLRDAFTLGDPAHPGPRAQARILSRQPSRCTVVVGEPARHSELMARWEGHSGLGGDRQAFARFVELQARLAVDRAERTLIGARHKTAHDIVEDLLASRRFREGAEVLAASLGRPTHEVISEARCALMELASVQSRLARDLWVQMSRYLWARAYRLEVDVAGIDRVRELGRRHPLVFLPSHKSNLDGFVMASVMYDFGFPQNHVIGGKNMGFWPLGPLGRRVGVVWIRRSFGGDPVYKFALRRYLAHLASKRFNLEWYIEGGRSRSGKLLPPRLGLLNYLAQGVEEAGVEEVMLVPVSIVYDRLQEVIEMTAESRGAVKRPEGLRWLLGYARQQRGELGRVQVRFGEPVGLRRTLAQAAGDDATGRSLALSKVAFELCTRINRATPVTPISIATMALLGMDGWAVTLAQAQTVMEPLVNYVERRALPGSEALSRLRTAQGVLEILGTLTEHGVLEAFGGAETVYRIRPDRELAAAFYRNVVVHWFVNRAIVELSLVAAAESAQQGEGRDATAAALAEAWRIRDLLKFEFFFADRQEFQTELREEVGMVEPGWRDRGGAALVTLGQALAETGVLMAERVLRSFIEAYYVVADRLAARGGAAVQEADLIDECLRVGRQFALQRRIVSPEAVSAELFRTGMRLAANRGLLVGDPALLVDGRRAFAAELQDVLRRLEILAGWERSHRRRRIGELAPEAAG